MLNSCQAEVLFHQTHLQNDVPWIEHCELATIFPKQNFRLFTHHEISTWKRTVSSMNDWLSLERREQEQNSGRKKATIHACISMKLIICCLIAFGAFWTLPCVLGKKMSAHKSLKTTRCKKTSLVLHGKGWMLKSWHLYRSQRNTPQQDTKMHLLHRDGTPPTPTPTFSLVFVVIRRLPWDFSLSASLRTTCTWARWKRERGERGDVEKD